MKQSKDSDPWVVRLAWKLVCKWEDFVTPARAFITRKNEATEESVQRLATLYRLEFDAQTAAGRSEYTAHEIAMRDVLREVKVPFLKALPFSHESRVPEGYRPNELVRVEGMIEKWREQAKGQRGRTQSRKQVDAMLTVIGVDQSITHTVVNIGGQAVHIVTKPKDFAHKLERLEYIRREFVAAINDSAETCASGTRVAYVEGYGFGSQVAHTLGELGGMLQLELWRRNFDVYLVPPSTLKKFVCGKGNGEKSLVMKAVFQRFGYDASDDNDADAYALYAFGMWHQMTLNPGMPPLDAWVGPTKAQLECFKKIELLSRKKSAA